jgi:hypothetical protein
MGVRRAKTEREKEEKTKLQRERKLKRAIFETHPQLPHSILPLYVVFFLLASGGCRVLV